ncbi:DnaJ protein [Rickenella mellea]|uniref:DnaJ homolog 1, mitochondrial n=1 Tax=Rickenella mellea TaxID=50990 RepID=A0A4Y7QN36_9AGAM|nr:DnaJ protein [Rickenella mellea]
MSHRIAQRTFSFISFHACAKQNAESARKARTFSTCLRSRPSVALQINSAYRQATSGGRRNFHSSAPVASTPKDPYQVLGVPTDAPQPQIKKSYYELARKYHPDTNKDDGAQEKFVEIQTAYDTLSDEKKRAAYDRYGAASQQPGFDPDAFSNANGPFGAGGFGGFQDFGSAFGAAGGRGGADLFEQLFGSAFGSRGRGKGPGFNDNIRGDDLQASIGVSFLDAARGTTRTINITPVVNCSSCSGSGLKPGAKRSSCSTCGGSGTRTFVIDSGFQMASTCPTCQGTGSVVPRGGQCNDCSGMGKVRARKSVSVDIPAGVEDGMTIRVPGEGDAPISGKGAKGDLLVRVNVAASKAFRRQGVNLHHEARIPLHTALLGGRVRVPTLDGDVDVRVPGGTQQGEEMVLKGRGVTPVFGGDKGDLFVTFAVQLPRSLSKRQREILQQYAEDVEGRHAATGAASYPKTSEESSSQDPPSKGEMHRAPQADNNGTASFTQPSPFPSGGGWIFRTWQKIRGFIGL